MNEEEELIEKRLALRQKLKSQLLTLSPSSHHVFNSFNPFIPNIRDLDFLEKQGLDCVMNYLQINSSAIDEQHCPNMCANCQSDCTENWWWYAIGDDQTRIYYCDQCEQNRLRNFILEQHRQSMKSAFLQAKESERRLEVHYHKQRHET